MDGQPDAPVDPLAGSAPSSIPCAWCTLKPRVAHFAGPCMNITGLSGIAPAGAFRAETMPTHTVQRGDTLWMIARQNGTSVDALMHSNPEIVNADIIYPDQVIRLPVGQNQPTPSNAVVAQPDDLAPAAASPDLRLGSRGSAVSDLQQQLLGAGFDPGPVDGWFGPRTQAAVREFQSSRGLDVDGWVGPQTWGALGTSVSGTSDADGSATPVGQTTTTTAPLVDDARVQTALDFAVGQLGAPYVGGGSPFRFGEPGDGGTYQMAGQNEYVSPEGVIGFDCSGFVVAMYRQSGIDLMQQGIGNTRSMHAQLPAVAKQDLQPGDLLVKPGSHVVVYLGDRDGDGRAEVIESKPGGVTFSDADKFLADSDYDIRRVPT